MKRITFRDDNNRAKFTVAGNRIYCSTQAAADLIATYEEMLESLGFIFEDNAEDIRKKLEIEEEVRKEWKENCRAERE